uniref:Uncharacterized protein n=1 Tax=Physcomitrium patens TaxID=3218 RepID=A0A7I3ZPR5_PHYPA
MIWASLVVGVSERARECVRVCVCVCVGLGRRTPPRQTRRKMKPPSQKSIIIASSHQIAALLCERRRPSGAIRPSPPLLSSSSSSCEASSLCLPACLPASPQFATKQTPPYATHTQCHPSLAAGQTAGAFHPLISHDILSAPRLSRRFVRGGIPFVELCQRIWFS